MHLLKLLLPVLSISFVAAQSCDGILKGDVCCSAGCGECGGSGCGDRGGGLTGDDCCHSDIIAANVPCGSAPCILGASAPTPTPPTPTPPTPTPGGSDGSCDDGILQGDVCCVAACETCGGTGCSTRNGLTGDECCTSNIKAAGVSCGEAPCIVTDDAPSPADDDDTPSPPSPSSSSYSYVGCFVDSPDRVLSGDSITSSNSVMTTAYCADFCEGSDYFGVQFGYECFCSSSGDTPDELGESEDCEMACSGDSSEICGGFYAIQVYEYLDDDTPTPVTPTPSGDGDYESVGCFVDDASDRVLSGDSMLSSNSVMTAAYCADLCEGSTYFGTEYGFECFCSSSGDSPDELGEASNCDMACSGDSSETCGGFNAIQVYMLEDGPAPTPIAPSPTTPVGEWNIPAPSPTSNPSPTPLMEIPDSCGDDETRPEFRYAASSGVAGRLYAEGEGCFTMTDLYNFRGTENDGSSKGPVYILDDDGTKLDIPSGITNNWLLAAELYVTGGGVFYCKGTSAGGDCNQLRIQSTGSADFHEVRGHGGSLYFEDTIVTSWDTPNKEPQETYEGGRSFLNCVSEKLTGDDCEGNAKNEMGECRMDIINSEIAYLGYFDSESYGMTWKVRGFCKDLSNPEVFELTNVYGDLTGSDIHHLYYGHYSYGHQGGVWTNNKMHDNWQYGFDPHDDSDYLTIAYNEVYNNVNHGIIASKRCNNVKIFENEVRDGGAAAAGIFLHRSSDGAAVFDNTITNMQDAGIAMLESFDAQIYGNTINGAKYGIRMSLGSGNNVVYQNSFTDISQDGLYTYQGSDEPDVSDGRPSGNVLALNLVEDCPIGVKIKEGDDNEFYENTFINVDTFEFPESTNTLWSGNDIGGGCIEEDDEFDAAPGSDSIPIC
ncbi:unnamed protein product [Ectocarpus sp. 12 AP-2014]